MDIELEIKNGYHTNTVIKIIKLVKANPYSFNIYDICEATGYSRSRIYELLKEYTGLTGFKELITMMNAKTKTIKVIL